MNTKSFYTITAPNSIRPYSDFNITCNFSSAVAGYVYDVQFIISGRDFSNKLVFLKNTNAQIKANEVHSVKIPISELPTGNYKLKVQGFSDPLIDEEKLLEFKAKTQSTIIQTDKATYKPGDKVQFRVLLFDAATKPMVIKENLDVHVTDSANNRIKQWTKQSVAHGVFKGELQLSSNPILGRWCLIAVVGEGVETRKFFDVQEYVLPKFEVKVSSPDHIELREGKLVATINAKYTYGKPIKGNAKITVYTLPWMSAPKPDLNMALLTKTVPIEGRQVVEFDMKDELKLEKEDVSTYLLIDVSVEEELTGRKLEATTTTTISNKVHHIEFVEVGNFKPGLPYTVVMQVKCHNDGPLEITEEPLKVEYIFDKVEAAPISYQIGKSGLVTATVNAPKAAKKLTIKAKYLKAESSRDVDKEYSKSESYIRAQVLSNRVVKGKVVAVSVQGTELMQEIFYFVIGRGTILMSGHCHWEGKDHKTTFEFPTNFQMVPNATLLVYYIRSDAEIVSDRLKLTFEDDLSSKISLELAPGKAQPGEDVTLTIKTAPKSYTALVGVDQSVLLLKEDNDLTRDRVFQELKEYDLLTTRGEYNHQGFGCYRPPFIDDFAHCGLVLMTNATKNEPDPQPIMPMPEQFARRGAGVLFGGPPMAMAKMQHQQFGFGEIQMDSMVHLEMCSSMPMPQITIRKEFPETWLWEDFPENESGELNVIKRVPDTITSWIITGFAMNSEHGLGLTKSPTKLTVFRPFFVSASLPYSVKRGEVLKIPVTVFNYTPKPAKSNVVLENKDNEFEIIDSGTGGSMAQEVDVSADNGATVYFTIKPTKVGYIVLKITAATDIAGDGIEQPLLVLAEGVKKQANKAVLLDLRSKPEDTTQLVCEIPADIIPDSVKVEFSAIGDILGPTISNLDKLVSIPCGCGEQTLILMVPSILVYDYLCSVDKMTEKMETKIKNCISVGYQNELTFQHHDGSFSAFGNSDPKGSVWLTAFAIKSFMKAKQLKFDIDQNVIDRALAWLCDNQAPNGSFPEVGNVIHKDMQGNAGEGLALTVYTTIALIQSAGDVFTDPKYKAIIGKAVAFIAEKVEDCDEIYTIAMAAYCLQLAKHDNKDVAMKKLGSKAIEADGHRYWEKPGSQTKTVNSWCEPSSVNVEITSYALLAYLAAGEDIASIPILKWLIGQRNGKGGGQSTQDTVLSLEALACFAKKIFSGEQSLHLLAANEGNNMAELNINKENAMVLQKFELSDKITKIDVTAKGSGIALVQVTYEYNVNDMISPIGFNLDVRVNSAPSASVLNLIVLASFSPHGDVKVSNMALLEIVFPSGFSFDSDCKPAIMAIPKVKKLETQNGDTKLVVYCDNVDEKGLMIPVSAIRMFDVSEQKPSIVEIYDYYENARRASKYYSLPSQ